MKNVNGQLVPSFAMLSRALLSAPDLADADVSLPPCKNIAEIDVSDPVRCCQGVTLPKDILRPILVEAVHNGASYRLIRQVCKYFRSVLTIESLIVDFSSALYVTKMIEPLVYTRLFEPVERKGNKFIYGGAYLPSPPQWAPPMSFPTEVEMC